MITHTIDIAANKPWPAGPLSNFTPHEFVLDGVRCASMEGLLQSLKYNQKGEQPDICALFGKEAENAGRLRSDWQDTQILRWRGQKFDRHSQQYQDFLTRAFAEMCFQNQAFRAVLLETGHSTLIHSIGNRNPRQTVLTEDEFCSRLMDLRAGIQRSHLHAPHLFRR